VIVAQRLQHLNYITQGRDYKCSMSTYEWYANPEAYDTIGD
jgi:hypothetical protein